MPWFSLETGELLFYIYYEGIMPLFCLFIGDLLFIPGYNILSY